LQPHGQTLPNLKTLILRNNNDDIDDIDAMDGECNYSVEDINRFLTELILLADQAAPGAPVLELQIGEILTRTAVEAGGADQYLSITGLLPRCAQPHYLSLPVPVPASASASASASAAADQTAATAEFLWHADEGRYIVVRKIPVTDLPDGFSIMDAILLTADLATTYLSSISAG